MRSTLKRQIKDDRVDAYLRWYLFVKYLFRPPNDEPVADWCHKNVQFNEPGHTGFYELNGYEYIIEPLNLFADWRVTDTTLVFGSQTGKTAMLQGGMVHTAYNKNIRALWVMTSEFMASDFAKTRWNPMLRASITANIISGKFALQYLQQRVGGSIIDFRGANSAGALSSNPDDVVILDETDKFPSAVRTEADAVNLAEQRTKNAPNPKRIKTSTPNLETGLIWQEFLKGDQRRYFLPCKHCGNHILLAWSESFYTFPKRGCEAYVKWDRSCKSGNGWNYDGVEHTAYFECPFCKGRINDEDKAYMLKHGEWKPQNDKAPLTHRSYQLSSLYSTSSSCSVGKMAVKFLQAKYSVQGLHGFVNGDLAEPWIAQEDYSRTEWIVSQEAELHPGEWARFITADYQETVPHLWWVCRTWDRKTGDSRLIEHGSCADFDQLEAIQKRLGVSNAGVGVDCGYNSETVYSACAAHGKLGARPYDPKYPWKQTRIVTGWNPMKGFGKNQGWFDKYHNPQIWGLGDARLPHREFSMLVVEFNSPAYKDILVNLRKRKTREKWEVAAEWDTDEYRMHLMGEVKKERVQFGMKMWRWEKRTGNWPNHLLDCEVMQLALASRFGALQLIPNLREENRNGE